MSTSWILISNYNFDFQVPKLKEYNSALLFYTSFSVRTLLRDSVPKQSKTNSEEHISKIKFSVKFFYHIIPHLVSCIESICTIAGVWHSRVTKSSNETELHKRRHISSYELKNFYRNSSFEVLTRLHKILN